MSDTLSLRVNQSALIGMAFMAVGALTVPTLDVISKLLLERLPTAQVGAGRLLVQSLVLVPCVVVAGQMRLPHPLQLAAGGFLGLAVYALNAALREMPVANAIAIFFVQPLILTLLAGFLLGEGVGWRRLTAVLVGLLGALVVLRPNVGAYGWAAAWPLAAAVFFASYMTISRGLSRRGGHLAHTLWTGTAAMVVILVLGALLAAAEAPESTFLMPTLREALLFLTAAVLGILVTQCFLQALSRADASALAPLGYLEIVAATGLGWLVFGDFPDALTWVGTAIIVSAGIYVIHRERVLARRAAASVGKGAAR
jgi:drug/metabolite transporter (DMT)-like permease